MQIQYIFISDHTNDTPTHTKQAFPEITFRVFIITPIVILTSMGDNNTSQFKMPLE